jgi:thioredoxin 1
MNANTKTRRPSAAAFATVMSIAALLPHSSLGTPPAAFPAFATFYRRCVVRAPAATVSTPRSAMTVGDDDGGGGGAAATTTTTTPEKEKLVIPLVTDANSRTLLRPPDGRPVLVDAFAPWCGPCKLLDGVLRKAQPRYSGRVDFVRWNVDDADGTRGLRDLLESGGHALSKLPSLVVFRDGAPAATRAGFANEFQLDDFLERTLPDVLERTFDERGFKMTTTVPAAAARPPSAAASSAGGDRGGATTATPSLPPPPGGTASTSLSSSSSSVPAFLEAREDCEVVAGEGGGAEEERCEIVVVEADAASSLSSSSSAGGDCDEPRECLLRLERTAWRDRAVVPAMDGIGSFLPARARGQEGTTRG